MSINKDKKEKIIQENKLHDRDTGSTHVQVALLTERINGLSEHFKLHKKDHHSRQGLLRLVNQRRKLLDHLKDENKEEYEKLIKTLKLRK
ncbi:MAG: 30S ribosomal protein S15 [Candidatus Omnitrophica bacterium]|nr:30S ribosomal protein S15 [Candidatus Omnitrophota bacterium]